MKILITGATGFLGSHLCHRLASEGHNVTILRRATSNAGGLSGLNVHHEIGDVTEAESVQRAIKGQSLVIHAAASLTRAGGSKALQYRINVDGTQNVVDACVRHRVKRLLHISSVGAIGIPDDPSRPANEDFPFNLDHSALHYHISKHCAEAVVAEGVELGLDAVIVNPTGISGPAGSFFRGSEIVNQVRRARILPYPLGGVCVVHVDDVVNGVLAAMERGVSGNRYILGGENLSFLDLMQKAADTIGVRRWYVPVPAGVTRLMASLAGSFSAFDVQRFSSAYANYYCASRYSFYDSSKARRDLDFKPRGFDSIVEECVRFLDMPVPCRE